MVKTKSKKSHAKKTDYTNAIFNEVRKEDGITKDGVSRNIGGYRNAVMEDIKKMCDKKILEYKKGGLHIINENLPTITKSRKNLQDQLKNYREIIKNVLLLILVIVCVFLLIVTFNVFSYFSLHDVSREVRFCV